MQVTTAKNALPIRHRSLVDMVAMLRVEFSNTRDELRCVHSENSKLKKELAKWQSQRRVSSLFDLSSLRRAVAFYCHPDRGGNDALMSQINTLFDLLAGMECSQELRPGNCAKGAAS